MSSNLSNFNSQMIKEWASIQFIKTTGIFPPILY